MFMHSTIATAIADQHSRDLITRADAGLAAPPATVGPACRGPSGEQLRRARRLRPPQYSD